MAEDALEFFESYIRSLLLLSVHPEHAEGCERRRKSPPLIKNVAAEQVKFAVLFCTKCKIIGAW